MIAIMGRKIMNYEYLKKTNEMLKYVYELWNCFDSTILIFLVLPRDIYKIPDTLDRAEPDVLTTLIEPLRA